MTRGIIFESSDGFWPHGSRRRSFLSLPRVAWGGWHIVSATSDVSGGGTSASGCTNVHSRKAPPPGASRHPRASFARLYPTLRGGGTRKKEHRSSRRHEETEPILRHARPCAGHPRPFPDGSEEPGWPGRCAKRASRFLAMTTGSCSALHAIIASASEAIHRGTGKKVGLLRRIRSSQ